MSKKIVLPFTENELFVTADKSKIFIEGTPINIDSCYCRVEFLVRHTGREMDVALFTFFDKSAYEKSPNTPLVTNLNKFMVRVELDGWRQLCVQTALHFMKEKLIQDGYKVE
jgi:hypothetical protein